MVEVAALAATAAAVLDSVAITATRRRTRSAASSGNLSSSPPAQRNSIATVFPSTKPASLKPLRNPAKRLAFGSGEPECRNPMTGIAGCCARAASGHAAAAPPSMVMNARLCTSVIATRFVMAGHSASEDPRERAYVRPSTSLPHQQRKTWMPRTRRGTTSDCAASLDHPIGEQLQRVGHGEAKGCGGFEIDDKLVSERELNRQITWACAPQDPIDVRCCRSHELELIDPIGHQTSTLGIEAERIDRGQAVSGRQCDNEVALCRRQRARRYDQAAALLSES